MFLYSILKKQKQSEVSWVVQQSTLWPAIVPAAMEVSKLPDLSLRCRIVFPFLLFHSRNLILGHKVSSQFKHTYVPQNDLNLLLKKLWLAIPLKKNLIKITHNTIFFCCQECACGALRFECLKGFKEQQTYLFFFSQIDKVGKTPMCIFIH